jgi:polyhydroxybutyrate depolymerase
MVMERTNILASVCISLLLAVLLLLTGYGFGQVRRRNDLQANSKPGDYERSLTVGGRGRSYIVHVPPTSKGQNPSPLVIVLHGGGGNAQNAMRMTGMSDKADREGFIVVYPNGTSRLKDRLLTWNAGDCCGYALDHQVDDIGFISTLIENVQKEFNIDATRIYVTGMSNGAKMAYQLGCKLSNKIAAIAAIAGSLDNEICRPASSLSVIIFHGTADEHVLYEGGNPKKQADIHARVDKPVSYAVSFWVKHNQCSTIPQKREQGHIVQETYRPCKGGAEVVLYTIEVGGHAWPGGKKGRLGADEPTQEISATDLMWDFFMRHPKG